MSAIPKKGTIIINPKTQRPVRVGSRTWLKLVKEGLIQGHYSDPNEIYDVKEGDNEEELINQFNQTLPPTQQAVRGRGKYANKIVKRNKQPSTRQITQHTARTTAKKLKDPQVYEQLQEADDFEAELENLIMAELAGIHNEPIKVKPRNYLKQKEHAENYYTQQPREEYEEVEYDDDDEYEYYE
jgi:hypothetical protein